MTPEPDRVAVRSVGPESAGEILAVTRAAFGSRPPLDPAADALQESEESLARLLTPRGGLLATVDGRPVGALVLDPGHGVVFWRRFGVVPAAQGHGVAATLVARALAECRDVDRVAVLAREELPETMEFWRHQGFWRSGGAPPYVELTRRQPETHDVPTPEDMHTLGERLARDLCPGDLVVLTGGLGAGKTTLTQGIGAGLGVRGDVTSPTFVIARVHPSLGDGPDLVHVDAYRLGGSAELDDLDLDTSLDDAVTVVEWGEGLAEGLADSRLEVDILRAAEVTHDLDPRRVEVVRVGPRWDEVHRIDARHGE